MSTNNNGRKMNVQRGLVGSAAITVLFITTAIDAANLHSAVGIGLLTASVFSIGVILGTTLKGRKKGAQISA